MLRGVFLPLALLMCSLAAEAERGRMAKLWQSLFARRMHYELKIGERSIGGVALPASRTEFYQNERQALLADFYCDMLIHYHDDKGRSAIGIAQYFNATNLHKIRVKDPFNGTDKTIIDTTQISGVLIAGHDHQHRDVNFYHVEGQAIDTSHPLPEQAELLYGKIQAVFSDGYRIVVADVFEQSSDSNPNHLQGRFIFLVADEKIELADDTGIGL